MDLADELQKIYDSEINVEVMGERYAAVRHTRPLYDPDRRAIMAA